MKLLKRLLALVMICATLLSMPIYAEYNGGSGGAASYMDGGGTWDGDNIGWRVYIVDPETGTKVSNTVDIVTPELIKQMYDLHSGGWKSKNIQMFYGTKLLNPSGYTMVYCSDSQDARIETLSTTGVVDIDTPDGLWSIINYDKVEDQIPNIPSTVLFAGGVSYGNGDAFRTWIHGGESELYYHGPDYSYTPTNPDPSPGGGGGNNTPKPSPGGGGGNSTTNPGLPIRHPNLIFEVCIASLFKGIFSWVLNPLEDLVIPTYADEEDEENYLDDFINLKFDGELVFNVTGNDEGIYPSTLVYENGYYVVIEPIQLYMPEWASTGSNPHYFTRGYWFYGTPANHGWAAEKGMIPSSGYWRHEGDYGDLYSSNYANISNGAFAKSFMLEENFQFGSSTVSADYKEHTHNNGYAKDSGAANPKVGYGLHVYTFEQEELSTSTRDPDKEPNPHPAPKEQPKDPENEEEVKKYRYTIVKVYEEEQQDKSWKHERTEIRTNTLSKIQIETEEWYNVKEWFAVSGENINISIGGTTEWETIRSGLQPYLTKYATVNGPQGSLPIVDIGDLETSETEQTTLFVLLRKPYQEGYEILDNEIHESQLTKAISTANKLGEAEIWGEYWFKATMEAAQTAHPSGRYTGCMYIPLTDGCAHSITTARHMTRTDSGGDNRIYSKWVGLHEATPIETESKEETHACFKHLIVSGSKIGEYIEIKNDAVGNDNKTWTLNQYYQTEDKGIAYFTTLWRGGGGIDPNVTIASYKEEAMSTSTVERLKTLFRSVLFIKI